MHVVVLGAGVVGATTAYYLSQQGHRVTVIDRADDVAAATSHANGGQLSYGFAEALATPQFVRKIPALLAGRNFATRIHLSPDLIPWGLRFLLQCTSGRARANTLKLLDIASASASLMNDLQQHVSMDYSFRAAGKLVLLTTDDEVQTAELGTALKRSRGIDVEMLSRAEAETVEPAISDFRGAVKAAVFSKHDDVADARRFVSGLRVHLENNRGVEFRLRTSVESICLINGRVASVRCNGTGGDEIAANAVVVCLGAWSDELLRPLGIRTRTYPVRGYSVTLPIGRRPPSASLTSLTNRFVFSRLNSSMRIAGFTDFDGFSKANDCDRVATLVAAAKRLAPEFADYEVSEQHPWGGFRPMTPSGLPIVGRCGIEGLYLNTGHGMLGWTLACATAKSVADTINGNTG